MKKEINSKSKRKWVAGGLAAFASIALLTTGFATWVVGSTKLDGSENITVNVDTAENRSIEFNVTINDASITLAEDTSVTGPDKFVKTEGATNGDLTITFTSMTIEYGRDSKFDPSTKKLMFSIVGNKTVTPSEDDIFSRSGNLTYIDAPADTYLSDAGESNSPLTGNITYTFSTLTYKFKWGSLFNGKSPLTYYNEKFDAGVAKTSANAQKVVEELNNMNAAYRDSNNTITLKLEIVDR